MPICEFLTLKGTIFGVVWGSYFLGCYITWRARGLSKSFIIRAIIGVTPFRVLIALLITYLLSPLAL